MQKFVTENSRQTQKLGELLAQELWGGEVLCLSGELGAGKTTFTQGLLKGLKVKGPYTSPTFVIMRHYQKEITNSKKQISNKKQNPKHKIQNIYHIDAYRIKDKDMLNLGWKEIMLPPVGGPKNIVIIEWAERVKKILPKSAIQIKFEWAGESRRKIIINSPY